MNAINADSRSAEAPDQPKTAMLGRYKDDYWD